MLALYLPCGSILPHTAFRYLCEIRRGLALLGRHKTDHCRPSYECLLAQVVRECLGAVQPGEAALSQHTGGGRAQGQGPHPHLDGASPLAGLRGGESPLWVACFHGCVGVARVLLAARFTCCARKRADIQVARAKYGCTGNLVFSGNILRCMNFFDSWILCMPRVYYSLTARCPAVDCYRT